MRTVKHKIKPLTTEQKTKFFAVAYAYQFEKNYFSDLFSKFSRKTFKQIDDDNIIFNCVNNSFISIQNQLVKSQYQSVNNLQARAWKMALKEAYELHVRTYEAQVALLKDIVHRKIYTFYQDSDLTNAITLLENTQAAQQEHLCKQKQSLKNESVNNVLESSEAKADSTDIEVKQDPLLNFLSYSINYLFYNYSTFKQFEEQFYSKKFTKARVYQRIQPILQDLLGDSKAVKKEVLTKEQAKKLSQLFELAMAIQKKEKSNRVIDSDVEDVNLAQLAKLAKLLRYYCHCLVRAIRKFRRFKIIQSQINPTITLDGQSYKLYSKYDNENKKNRWFLDIMSLEKGKRIEGLELTGFHHAKKIMKHKKYANLTLSFDPVEMVYYAHFTFKSKAKPKKLKNNKKKVKAKSHQAYVSKNKPTTLTTLTATTIGTIGGDFGLTESFTFSDGWVAGRTQKKILKDIADSTKDDVAKIQSNSQRNYFGLEKNNPEHKRNHINNCFNHNSEKNNINTNYRKRQKRYNSHLENYKYEMVNDIIHHFTTDNEYGQYAKYGVLACSNTDKSLTKLTLVFEDLTYTNLGRTKDDKRQINLIKGVLTLLEEKIKLYHLPIEIKYVNPAYTSQSCPSCYYVDRKNRNSRHDSFRCLHCGFTADEDVRYQALTTFTAMSTKSLKSKVIQRAEAITLPSKDDFIAACNIAERLSVLPNSMKLHQSKIKDLLMEKHEQVKGSCKMFDSR